MPRTLKASAGPALLCALVLAGCGNASSSTTPTEIPTIRFKSSAVVGNAIPAKYTCDGANISPPLEWGPVPAGTGSLALFLLAIIPEPATHSTALSLEWSVAGLSPQLHRLAAGQLPPGAYVGLSSKHSQRYSICPPKGTPVQYQFELYGLPGQDRIAPGFEGLPILSALSSPTSKSPASVHGLFAVIYKRK